MSFGPDIRQGAAEWNGEGEVVGGIVVMRYGLNALNVIAGVKKKLADVSACLAPGVEIEPEPGKTKLLCPNANGARNWPTTAFGPATYILYVVETCADYSWTPRSPGQIAAGGDDIHFGRRPRPDSDGKLGRIEAINPATGKVLWIHRQRAPVVSSLLATGGDLVFIGALDRFFSAYNAAAGKLLWPTQLNAAPNSSPVTYMSRASNMSRWQRAAAARSAPPRPV